MIVRRSRPHEHCRAEPLLGTIVRVHVIDAHVENAERAVARAFDWFREVESRCTRFEPDSELMRLTARTGIAVPVSPLIFQTLQFALAVAAASGGAFDPAVGLTMEALGFNRHDRTGRVIRSQASGAGPASYRDVELDAVARTVTVHQPLVLDLGAVAKGLAIDLAVQELRAFEGFAIDAGGDLFLGGQNAEGEPWSVGIRDPGQPDVLLETVRVSDRAVCTSGDYERRTTDDAGHHIVDPRTARTADAVASATVVARTAIVADALATAAFVLGPVEGLRLLEAQGVEGLLVSAGGVRNATAGFAGERTCVS